MNEHTSQTQYVSVEGGRIAYEVMGQGPLVILSPGVADTRASYRFLAPMIAAAGFRVASVDLRGHGESSTDWDSYSRTHTAGDLVAVISQLGGPAVIVGQSFSGGSATIAAAAHPDVVRAVVEIDPFTRPPKYSIAPFLRDARYRRGALLLANFAVTGRVKVWAKYLEVAYPGRRPADWDTWLASLLTNLREPGRAKAAQKMLTAKPVDAGLQLANVRCPVLVVMGREDSDFPSPEAEAAAIVGLLPTGRGRYEMIDGAGHYPHAQYPQQVSDVVLPFLAEHHHA